MNKTYYSSIWKLPLLSRFPRQQSTDACCIPQEKKNVKRVTWASDPLSFKLWESQTLLLGSPCEGFLLVAETFLMQDFSPNYFKVTSY